jgi:ankyrin repeat protein
MNTYPVKNIKPYTEHIRESKKGSKGLGRELLWLVNDKNPPDIERIKRLIGEGASLESTDRDGYTPLRRAVFWGYTEAVKVLIEAGANVQARSKYDSGSMLRLAVNLRRIEEAKSLIDAGVEISTGFNSFQQFDEFFGGDTDWIPEPVMRKFKRTVGMKGMFSK